MEPRTKIFMGLVVILSCVSFCVFKGVNRQTQAMTEDTKNLAMIKSLEESADDAAREADYDIAAERLSEAMKYFDKLHARPLSVEQRLADIKDRRYRLGIKAEAESQLRKQREIQDRETRLARERERADRLEEQARLEEEQARKEKEREQELARQAEPPERLPEQEPPEEFELKPIEDPDFKSRLAVATTQPATFNKYYNLIKNEFMKDKSGQIVLATEELDAAVAQIKRHAADEKEAIDQEILSLTQQIRQADAQRKSSEEQARDSSKTAREAARSKVHYNWSVQKDRYGRVIDSHFHQGVDPIAAGQERASRQQATQNKTQANTYKGNVNAMRAELGSLKKRSAALTAVASPHNRSLPPKQFWTNLSASIQDQLAQVGISQEEFIDVLERCGLSSEQFVQTAFVIDYEEKNDDLVVARLRKMFMAKMPPSPIATENFN